MNINEQIKSFWENCNTTFAHITADNWLKDKQSLINSFSDKFHPFALNGKRIIDYGIGAGHLGMYIFENEIDIEKYIGIDVAQRSIDAAMSELSKYDADKIELHLTPIKFSDLDADILCSFSVIQHFPNERYLDDFLNNIKESGINELILQIRYSKSNTFSRRYNKQSDVKLACHTNKKYILDKLEKYECVKETKVCPNTSYQYLYFKLKDEN